MPRTHSDQGQRDPARARRWRATLAATLLCLGATTAQALEVFTCEPEWAALVRELAPQARVRSATHALQDPHNIEARPSLIAALRRADLAVCTGAALEAGWLPMLQRRSGHAPVQDGADGMFYASDHVELIDPQAPGGPFDGHVHPEGNPHLHLDPRNLLDVAEALAQRLQAIDPTRAAQYQQRWRAFDAGWRQRIAQWEHRARPLRALPVAAQHSTHAYLWHWLGVRQVADLEPRPGLPPTPGHLQRLLVQTRADPPRAVVVSTYQDAQAGRWLAQQLGPGVPLLQLPASATDDGSGAPALAQLFEQLLQALLSAAPATLSP